MNLKDTNKNQENFFIREKLFLALRLKSFIHSLSSLLLFILIVAIYVLHSGIIWMLKLNFIPQKPKNWLTPKIESFYTKIMTAIDPEPPRSFNRSYLIELSFKNMQAKKTRTMVTMGGMAIGIAFIVFLVSVGYGLQNMVINRVARLDELKQADVVPGLSADLILNDEIMNRFLAIQNVKKALPVIAVVGKISYHQSVSDMAVYGVTTDYLKSSAIQPIKGKVFEDANMVSMTTGGKIAGSTVNRKIYIKGEETTEVEYVIEPSSWYKVRETASPKAELLGYTRKIEGKQTGLELVGEYYDSAPQTRNSKWIKTTIPLWEKTKCNTDTNAACEDNSYLPLINEQGGQLQIEGFMAELNMKVSATENPTGKVLALTTENTTGSLPVVNLASESAASQEQQKKVVELSDVAKRVAVVNRSVLQILNLPENEAVGKKISLSFVVVGDLMADQNEKVESSPVQYTIVGVTPDEGTPVIYVPFIDLRSLGIIKYSQIKLIVADTNNLAKVRATVEANGYGTVSVADTVTQINSLFSSLRLVLAILGMVALSVAALGMFNTLTVSLLERTREVGLMKAMGMKSSEVKDLFMTESMIMGFFGGVIGLIVGIVMGKILSLFLTTFSLIKGVGIVDVSFVPLAFTATVLALSIVVGILTGYFPAKRATKISALNALRYE